MEKKAKFDNVEKILLYRETEKGNQLNDKNIVSHSEIFKVILNREMHLTSSLHQHHSAQLVLHIIRQMRTMRHTHQIH